MNGGLHTKGVLMGSPGRPALSPGSAARLIAAWSEQYQRLPMEQECVTTNNLPHWTSIYRLFPGSCFSARLQLALDITRRTEGHGTTVCLKVRPCLGPGCTVAFLTTSHVRLCPKCRALCRTQNAESPETTSFSRTELQRFGIGAADWEEIALWDE